jgi:hypothetical protein
MKPTNILLVLLLAVPLMIGCGGTKSVEEIALKNRQFGELKELVASNSYAIDVKTAHPMQTYAVTQVTNSLMRNTGNNAGRIDVAGNYINVLEDRVEGGLAYYGEVRIANTLDPRDNGIVFSGEPLSYEVFEDDKKQTLKVEFEIKGNSMELFSIIMELYPSKRASIMVNSPNRNSIRYEGNLRAYDLDVSSK